MSTQDQSVFQLHIDCGNMGMDIDSLFVASVADVDRANDYGYVLFGDYEIESGHNYFQQIPASQEVVDFVKTHPIGIGPQVVQRVKDCMVDDPDKYMDLEENREILQAQLSKSKYKIIYKRWISELCDTDLLELMDNSNDRTLIKEVLSPKEYTELYNEWAETVRSDLMAYFDDHEGKLILQEVLTDQEYTNAHTKWMQSTNVIN